MSDVLQVNDLGVVFTGGKEPLPLVTGVSFSLQTGGCLGILGESGSGKSITCRAIMGLLNSDFALSGRAVFRGTELLTLPEGAMRGIRGKQIGMIMQNPLSAFDPLFTIGEQLVETFQAHLTQTVVKSRELALSTLVSMLIREPRLVLKSYPHQLSGGMLQRVMIGLTLALRPALIIADEPTTALDSVTQYEVLKELARIRQSRNTTMIFISHDLGALRMLADDVLVMYHGRPVEYGPAAKVFADPNHEHTRYLLETRRSMTGRFLELTAGAARTTEEGGTHVAG